MKRDEALKLLAGGYLGCLAEYRSCKTDEIPYVSKKTGRSQVMKKAAHNLEVGGQSVQMAEILKDDTDLTKFTPPAKKGQTVFVHLRELKDEFGMVSARGRCEVVAD